MPQVKKPAVAQRGINPQIETSEIDDKEVTKILRSILSREQAPTVAEQTPDSSAWTAMRDVLGPPFDDERVTLKQMRMLRKDPMIAFGLHYRKVPMVSGEWHIEARDKRGPNPQVAGFVDAALRMIYARLIFQRTLAYDFGFASIVKRFIQQDPLGVYEDDTDLDEAGLPKIKPVWNEGSILPKIWKAPVVLRPERVTPVFDDKTGEFSGMEYDVPPAQRGKSTGFNSRSKKKNQSQREVDVYHSYWGTHRKDDELGSIYGYPLTGFARYYWWAYWFLYHMSNRAYERIAIPPILAYHPPGSTIVDTASGATRPNWEIALEMAERLRSNAVAAVPSTMAETGMDSTSNSQREWDFKFMETPTEALSVFDSRFNYLNIMKLRAVWVPEMAVMGNEQGNSGGNIAETMFDVFTESLALDMAEIDDEINRYWIPQILIINFPEFVNNGGIARKVSHGFRDEDIEFYKQVVQLLGQKNPEDLDRIDLVEIFKRMNTPLKSAAALAAEREWIATQPSVAPAVTPEPGQIGVVANPNVNTGFTNGGSVPNADNGSVVAGFSDQPVMVYTRGSEIMGFSDQVELADMEDFLSSLPTSKHYEDKTIRTLAVQLRRIWLAHYRRLYPEFAKHIAGIKEFEFSDDDSNEFIFSDEGMFELADNSKSNGAKRKIPRLVALISKRTAERAAKKLVESWSVKSSVMKDLEDRTSKLMRKMVERAGKLEAKNANLKIDWDDDAIDAFLKEQTGRLIKFTNETTKEQLRTLLANNIREGKSPKEIGDVIVSHFEQMPFSRADRIARSETRDAVNAATLLTGEAAGIKYAQAKDAQLGPTDALCEKRDGKLYTIKEAWKEMRKTHPNDTLEFNLIPRADFSISYVNELPDNAPEGVNAFFDNDSGTAFIVFGEDGTDDYLTALAAELIQA